MKCMIAQPLDCSENSTVGLIGEGKDERSHTDLEAILVLQCLGSRDWFPKLFPDDKAKRLMVLLHFDFFRQTDW